jgi:hypothetical protein
MDRDLIKTRALELVRRPIARRLATGAAAFLLLYSLVGFFILPALLKSQASKQIAASLNRRAVIEKIGFKALR